jgi:glycosyltransferase involved in cell wall biosynthesis
MNIAVFSGLELHGGGGYQYELSTILLLNKHKNESYNFIFFTNSRKKLNILKEHGIDGHYFPYSWFDKGIAGIKNNRIVDILMRRLKFIKTNRLDKQLGKFDVDIIYFLSPSSWSLVTEKYHYIITVWDLCHRDHMEFPEVYINRIFEERERIYKNALPKAVKIITESEIGKQNIIRRYNVDENRIIALPLLPSQSAEISEEEYLRNFINIKKKYHIEGEYIFYPAQFWSHKNHVYILEGLQILKEKYNLTINAVFSGTDYGNLNHVMRKAKELELEKQVFYIGFVDNKEIPYLYRQAMALVMPTYFGPSNIPPLEAFSLGCPVLYSDLPDLQEHVKNAALLLDLNNPESLAVQIMKIRDDKKTVAWIVTNGKKKIEVWTEEDYWIGVKNALDDFAVKLKCWK